MSKVSPERLAEAGVWIARLHGDDRNRALEEGFKHWLQANPANAQAFELTTEVWEDSQNLKRVVPFAHEVEGTDKRTHRFVRPVLAVAATAALVALGLILQTRDESVSTHVGEQRSLTLADGTRVSLNTATHIVVRYDNTVRKVELESGEALFDVAKSAGRPFIVQAGDRVVTALGTSFVVRHEANRTDVTLVEGKISVTPLPLWERGRGEESLLAPGQRATFLPGRRAKIDTPSLDTAVAWRRGQVVLDDTPLSGAVAEMNRYNPVKLVVERPEAEALLVNGLFQAGDSMSFANAVAQTYGLRIVSRHGEILLSGTPQPVD